MILFAAVLALFSGTSFATVSYVQKGNTLYSDPSRGNQFPKIEFLNAQGSFFTDATSYGILVNDLTQNLNKLFELNTDHSFEFVKQFSDNLGQTHYVYQHKYKDVDVNGDVVLVHSKNEKVISVNGQVSAIQDLNISFSLSDAETQRIAQNHFEVTENVKISEVSHVIYKQLKEEEVNYFAAAKIQFSSLLPLKDNIYYIDASNGEILSVENRVHHIDTPSTSATYYRGNQAITVDSYSGKYRLKDNTRNIQTYNGVNLTGLVGANGFYQGATEYLSNTADFTANNTKGAVEAHWGMTKTYDYYKNIHNRSSYDGNGSIIRNYYNPPGVLLSGDPNNPTQNNAAAIQTPGQEGMVYGIGDGYLMDPVVGLDVAGHEFSHLVISRNGLGGLNYQGESGALNESFADIFGTSIEFYTNLSPNWTIGENLFKLAPYHMRDMSDPKNATHAFGIDLRQPDTYEGDYWADTSSPIDQGGVHINSGVGNKWYYLLCEGGSGTNDVSNSYNVTGIGISKAEKIVYRALVTYMPSAATFLDARAATISAAYDLYTQTEADAVAAAWYAVNVGATPTASVSEEEFNQGIMVYPNPTQNSFVNIDVNLSENTEVEMYDVVGKLVKKATILNEGNNQLNVSGIQSGVYLLKFNIEGNSFSKKLIIE